MPDASGNLRSFCTLPLRLENLLDTLLKPEKPEDGLDILQELAPVRGREDGISWEYRRWKPSVYKYVEPLHGHRGDALPEQYWYYVAKHPGEKNLPKYAVERPPLTERIKRFKQALRVARTFASWEDLIPIAVHRRQVTNVGGIREIDHPFYLLVWKARGFYRPAEIKSFAERMPPRSNVRGMLYGLAVLRLNEGIQEALYGRSSVHD